MTPSTPNQPAPAKPEHSALIEATIKKLRTSSGWWEGDPNARRVLGELLNNHAALLAALERTTNMLRAVCGDLEDGHDLRELRGKYFNAVLEAADDGRAAIRNATK